MRDINEAIKELGHMISAHTGASQTLTKLSIMQEAVNVITTLEQQLRGSGHRPARRRSLAARRSMVDCAASMVTGEAFALSWHFRFGMRWMVFDFLPRISVATNVCF